MKNITEFTKAEDRAEEMDTAGQARLIKRLAHDLRQPLSSIECIGYYLDMVLGDQQPEVQRQCATLRRMVQQAHWLLEDASLAVSVQSAACGSVSLSKTLTHLAAELALHEERSLELRMDSDVVATAPISETTSFCGHVLTFFRNVAQAEDPIRVIASMGGDVHLEFSAEVSADTDDLSRMMDPPQGGGLRGFVEAAHGQMAARVNGQRLTLSFWLPTGE